MFKNSGGNPETEYLTDIKKPRIIFPATTLAVMKFIVETVPSEVGWFGYVEQNGEDLTVTDIYVPGQHVNSGTCEMDEGDSLTKICLQIEAEGKDSSKIKFWGHSHASGGVYPSGQDHTQAMQMMKDHGDYMIRGICNKSGDMNIAFYDNTNKRIIKNIEWYIHDGIDRDAIKAKYEPIIKENVKELSYINQHKGGTGPIDGYDGFDGEGFYGRDWRNYGRPNAALPPSGPMLGAGKVHKKSMLREFVEKRKKDFLGEKTKFELVTTGQP